MFSAPNRLSSGLPLEGVGKPMPWTLFIQGGGEAQDITMALKSVLSQDPQTWVAELQQVLPVLSSSAEVWKWLYVSFLSLVYAFEEGCEETTRFFYFE